MTTPQHLSERYELGEIIGFGGMSEVHLARDQRLHRDVAIKVLRADLARDPTVYLRFRREAQNAAALNHPAIVAVYDTGEAQTPAGPLPYIVMEYVDGVTLRDIVHTDGPMEPNRAIEVIADACQALNFSHQHGIIHRDVKPANIMISKAGAVKVMDFGIARAIADTTRVTQTAVVVGTAQYFSPEQARGHTVDARSDVYSLGCVLYEILTGEPPFEGDSPLEVAYQHVREDPVPPSQRYDGISPELDAVVLRSLVKNPENRYQSAAEMRADLIRVHSGETPRAPKVLTDAERVSLPISNPARTEAAHTDRITVPGRGDSERAGPVARWLVAVAVLSVLAVVVAIAVNMIGEGPRVQVPDVTRLASEDAVAALQNQGFKTDIHRDEDAIVAPGLVITTEPEANTSVNAGDKITVHVSTGPKQRPVPAVNGLSPDEAERRLRDAGFENLQRQRSANTTVPKDTVIGTSPAADQLSAITNEITIEISNGPQTAPVPTIKNQTLDVARQILASAGFRENPLGIPVDSTEPIGVVVGTNPPGGVTVPLDETIQLQVSRGNQFAMPNLVGKFYDDFLPLLKALGWTERLNRTFVDAGVDNRAKVMDQSPDPGQLAYKDGVLELTFGS